MKTLDQIYVNSLASEIGSDIGFSESLLCDLFVDRTIEELKGAQSIKTLDLFRNHPEYGPRDRRDILEFFNHNKAQIDRTIGSMPRQVIEDDWRAFPCDEDGVGDAMLGISCAVANIALQRVQYWILENEAKIPAIYDDICGDD